MVRIKNRGLWGREWYPELLFQYVSDFVWQACALKTRKSGHEIGFTTGRSGLSLVHKRLHRNGTLGAGCHDGRRGISRLHDDGPWVVRSVGSAAAAATTAYDHADDKDKTAGNYASLSHIRDFIPPSKDT